jgi:hypothetical protein
MLEKLAVEQGNKICAVLVDVPYELLNSAPSGVVRALCAARFTTFISSRL